MPPTTPRSPNASGRETRQTLIRTAERLFAEHGVDAVSLRQISGAAGMSMYGAVSYHFGSKAGLIRAIIADRTASSDERRRARLEDLEAQGRTEDLRALTEAGVRPALEQIGETGYFFRFLAQLDRPPGALAALVAGGTLGHTTVSILKRQEAVAAAIAPRAVVEHRTALAAHLAVAALADLEGRGGATADEVMAADLIDCIVALYATPPSVETLAAARMAKRRRSTSAAAGAPARSGRARKR